MTSANLNRWQVLHFRFESARSMPTKLSGLGKHSWESRPRAGPAAGHWWPSERHDKIGADLKWASSGPAVAQQMNLCRVLGGVWAPGGPLVAQR